MDKCRLCLRVQKRVHSLNTTKDGIKYCNMVHSLSSNIKIDTGTDDKICITCCRKLEAAYNFKVMIERSNEELQNLSNTKRITFTTIEDIKVKIEIPEDKINLIKHDIIEQINSDHVEFKYNEILFRRKRSKKNVSTVVEFLNSFKESENSYDGYEVDVNSELRLDHSDVENEPCVDHSDVNYVPGKSYVNQRKKIKSEAKKLGKAANKDEKKFECEICKKAFTNPVTLKAHRSCCHLPKTLRCDQCVAVFSTKTRLLAHMTTHSNVKKYLCEICSKAFARAHQVQTHKAHVHNIGVKQYKCDHCEKTCKSLTLLKHHLRVHTGERPYKCEMCSQPYSYKHDFNRHCFKKHGVLFKRRSVYVMNEEVLMKERALMRDLMLRIKGVIKEDVPLNPFEGAQAAKAYDLITKALAAGQITLDFEF